MLSKKWFTLLSCISSFKFKLILLLVIILLFNFNSIFGQSIQKAYGEYCVGTDIIFTFTGPGSVHSWQPTGNYTIVSSSSTSATIRWNSAGSFSLTAVYSGGTCNSECYSYFYLTINDRIIPTISVSPTSTNICFGTSRTFTANITNGGSNPSISWQVNGVTVSGANSLTFTTSNLPEGNNTVTCSMYSYAPCNYTGSVSASVNASVKPFPIAEILPPPSNTICQGQSLTLQAKTGTGYSYAWIKTGSTTILSTSSSLLVNSSGTYAVRVSLNGCTKTSTGTIVTVNQYPVVSVDPTSSSICSGEEATLTGKGATSYKWYSSTNVLLYTGTIFKVKPSVNTTYKVVGTTNNCSSEASVTVTVKPLPTSAIIADGSTTFNGGGQVMLKATSTSTDYNYQWKLQGAIITGATTSTYAAKVSGDYTLMVTSKSNNCSKTSNIINVQVLDYNYITTTSIMVPGITTSTAVGSFDKEKHQVSTTYFDGLGRPMQNVVRQGSSKTQDIVQPIEYDAFGREPKKYLPYSGETNGFYKRNAIADVTNFYKTTNNAAITDGRAVTGVPFAETLFEPSPLNRVLEQGSPGEDWQVKKNATTGAPLSDNKTIKFIYRTNIADDKIRLWTYTFDTTSFGSVSTKSLYENSQLYVTETKDESNHTTLEFKDKEGRVVCKKVQLEKIADIKNDAHWLITTYVYDDFGNLRLVIPPQAYAGISFPATGTDYTILKTSTILNDFCFAYDYDELQRMIEKKVPGAFWVYMIYDKRDRLVLTQDGVQRDRKEWLFTKYDQLNRPVLSGIYINTTKLTRSDMQIFVNTEIGTNSEWFESFSSVVENVHGYDNASFPKISTLNDYLTVTYYDNYNFNSLFGVGFDYDKNELTGLPDENIRTKGLVTGGKIKVIGETKWIRSINYYDERYRVIQRISDNYLNGKDYISTIYNFPGWVMQTKHTHTIGSSIVTTTKKEFDYDHAGRLTNVWHTVNNGTENTAPRILLASQTYNELGELIDKKLHIVGNDPEKQSIDYRYNIRGWLTHINNSKLESDYGLTNDDSNDYFGMELIYNGTMGDFPMALNNPFHTPYPFDFHNPSTILASKKDAHQQQAIASSFGLSKNQTTEDLIREANERIENIFKEQNIKIKEIVKEESPLIIEKFTDDDDLKYNNLDIATSSLNTQNANVVLLPIDDTFVRSGNYAKYKYGSNIVMVIQEETTLHYGRISYLKFDVSTITSASSAKLRVYCSKINNTSSIDLSVFGVSDDSWTESTLYWNIAPSPSTSALSTVNLTTINQYYEFDITNFVQSQLTGDKIVSILIKDPSNQNRQVEFHSKENASFHPELVITQQEAPAIPAIPENFTATAASSSSINLSWASVSNATSYVIETSTGTSTVYSAIPVTLDGSATAYSHTGLQADTRYNYQIKAVNSAGSSAFSDAKYTKTHPITTTPSILVLHLDAANTSSYPGTGTQWNDLSGKNNHATLSSDAQFSSGSMRFNGGTSSLNAPVNFEVGNEEFSISYWLKPESFQNYNQHMGAKNGWNAFKVHTGTSQNLSIGTSSSTRISAANMYVLNTWVNHTFTFKNGVGKLYKNGVEIIAQDMAMPTTSWSGFSFFNVHGYLDKVLIYSNAISASEAMEIYNTDKERFTGIVSLAAPADFTASAANSSSINLSWTSVADATSYIITSSLSLEGEFTEIPSSLNGSATSFTHSGLQANTTYYYKIKAVNSSGSSVFTNPPVNAATPPLETPSNLVLHLDAGNPSSYPGTGTQWNDLSGKNNHATLTTNAQYVEGSMKFNGGSIGLNAPVDFPVGNEELTISYWIRTESYKNYNQHLGAVNGWPAFKSHVAADQNMYIGTNNGTRMVVPEMYPLNTWVNHTFTFKNGLAKLYKDGVEVLSQSMALPTASWNGFRFFDVHGNLDKVLIYSNAISASEALDIYNTDKERFTGVASLPIPENFTATAASSSSINLSWASVADATSYVIESSLNDQQSYTEIPASLNGSTTDYTHTGLQANTTYYYKIKAVNATGSSGFSEFKEALTLSNPSDPTTGTFPVAKNSVWKYNDKGTDLGTSWTGTSYDHTSWQSGAGVLGYGDPVATTLSFGPSSTNKYITYYFRHDFNVNDASIYQDLVFNIRRDDGAVVYLNGVEQFRTNMPEGTINYLSTSITYIDGSDESTYSIYKVPATHLKTGYNVVAVSLHQTSATSSDITFDMEVLGELKSSPVASDIRINSGGVNYTATDGKTFIADTHSSGGKSYTNSNVTSITGTSDPTLYLTEYSALTNLGSFNYAIPVSNGSYKVRLHFAEIYWGATGGGAGGINKRVFSVNIEGAPVLQNFDIRKEVGAMAALIKEFDVLNVGDGFINIDFTASVDQGKVSAIEIIPLSTTTVPAKPLNFTSSSATTSSINLSWEDVSNETSYELQYKLSSAGTYTTLPSLAANTTTFNHTGLLAGNSYNYILKAINSAGSSGNATYTGSTLQASATAPANPTDLKASVGGTTSIILEWEDNANNETGYIVEYRPIGGTWTVVNLPAGTTKYTHSGLAPDTEREYRIKAMNGGTGSAYNSTTAKTTSLASGTFTFTKQYNGNIAAVKWASDGGNDQKKERAYTYHYDPVNRLINSQYAQGNGVVHTNRGGYNESLIYDMNGNIKSLTRNGLLPVATNIDNLGYTYTGNQLMKVEDASNNYAGFKNGNAGSNDYDYDKNGNMTFDKNKGIDTIKYNHLNLPEKVIMGAGKYIEYVYDAGGQKLAQKVFENNTLIKQTTYIGGIIYEKEGNEADKLVMIQHEEGRIVPDAASPGKYEYQYHLKDHLGNVRVTFTSKPMTHVYKLNYEKSLAFKDDRKMFTETENTKEDVNFNHTTGGDYSQLLTGHPSAKIGSVIAIPVGAGDKVNALVQAKYKAINNPNNTAAAIAPLLMAALTGTSGSAWVDGASSAITNSYGSSSLITNAAYGYEYNKDAPLAFINLLFIPDKPQSSIDKAHFAFKQISINSTQTHETLEIPDFEAKEKGVVIVYLSNENLTFKEVYFDDLKITVNEHAVIQGDDYYPFGLSFNSFKRSTNTENKFKYNSKEEQEDWEVIDYGARMYQPDLGRWFNPDPLADMMPTISPYVYCYNSPLSYTDPTGMLPKYNWDTGKYEDDDGNEITFEEALSAHQVNAQRSSDGFQSNRKLNPEYIKYINFRTENNNYTIRENWVGSVLPFGGNLTDEFIGGYGPTNSLMVDDHPMTKALINAWQIKVAREHFYLKYAKDILNGSLNEGASWTNHAGKFGGMGLILAGLDVTEQFIGSMTIDVFLSENKENLIFRLYNSTSMTSAAYRQADEYERGSSRTPGGNTYQIYMWTEPINVNQVRELTQSTAQKIIQAGGDPR